ncbi:hypothetical protein D9611_007350 [Ephemerocybe angulata]|uniref:BTB domain-containing protein n=1 Tax=Ephemerocybe angulata TaxID=980116 RepID=A0A8H5CF89_9AGAR|nr:hypothetical protein D9611_007350 [Tulosesus angulatus]
MLPKSQVFWKDQGDVVIEASGWAYKVHQNILSQHSSRLGSMLMHDLRGTASGHSVLELEASKEGIDLMLRIMYHSLNVNEPISFDQVEALMHVGNKYEVKLMKDEAVERMKDAGLVSELAEYKEVNLELQRSIEYQEGLVFDIINIAVKYRLCEVLPVAFLVACPDYSRGVLESRSGTLSRTARDIWLRGREALDSKKDRPFSWVDAYSKTHDQCHAVMNNIKKGIQAVPFRLRRLLYKWNDFIEEFGREGADTFLDIQGLCKECRLACLKHVTKQRKSTWEELPSDFGLGAWEH